MTKIEHESMRASSATALSVGTQNRAPMTRPQGGATKRRAKNSVAPILHGKARKRDASATRARILEAAMEEFAARGLPDARIEDVALRARANRRMIYYYFGNKEGLYLAALEAVYAELMDEERKIDVEKLDPIEAITALVRLKIDHYTRYPRFIAFVNMENLYKARHLKNSKRLGEFKTPLTQIIARVLERGQRLGLFREGIEPVDLYISICALGYMYFSNQYTLGVIFGRKLISPKALEKRKVTIADFVTSYLTRKNISAERDHRAIAPLLTRTRR